MRISERVLRQVSEHTRFGDVRWLETVDSTNRWARDAVVAGASAGLVVVADHQSAGRGRLGREWEAAPGASLLVSVVLQPDDLPADRLHLLTALVGLAAREACIEVGGFTPDLKWPNDLLVGGRKLAGILAEVIAVPAAPGLTVVVGLGINLTDAPPGAVAADEAAGGQVERDALLAALLEAMERRYGRWDQVAGEYRARSATVGQRVRISGADGSIRAGTATGIDDTGRLIVAFDGDPGAVAVSVGDVVHLRPAPASG